MILTDSTSLSQSNSTGFGLYALNMVGFVHIQNSVFIYNTGYIGGNTALRYDETMGCSQVIDTLLHVENSLFAYGEMWYHFLEVLLFWFLKSFTVSIY